MTNNTWQIARYCAKAISTAVVAWMTAVIEEVPTNPHHIVPLVFAAIILFFVWVC